MNYDTDTERKLAELLNIFTARISTSDLMALAKAEAYLARANMQLGLSAQAQANTLKLDLMKTIVEDMTPYNRVSMLAAVEITVKPAE
jgi:hypothetical protein